LARHKTLVNKRPKAKQMGGEWGAGKKIKKEKSNKTQTLSTDPPISPPLLFLFCTLFFLHSFRAILLGMFTLFSAVLFRFCFFFFVAPFVEKTLKIEIMNLTLVVFVL